MTDLYSTQSSYETAVAKATAEEAVLVWAYTYQHEVKEGDTLIVPIEDARQHPHARADAHPHPGSDPTTGRCGCPCSSTTIKPKYTRLTRLRGRAIIRPLGDRARQSMRGGAVAARRAHNPKVLSSNLSPATIFQTTRNGRFFYQRTLEENYWFQYSQT